MSRGLTVFLCVLLLPISMWATVNVPSEEPIHFVVIIPSYNNQKYCDENLSSLAMQSYKNWSAIYINDCSTDETQQKVEEFIAHHHLQDKIKLINNKKNMGAMANFYNAIHTLPGHHVVVNLDGDDRLAHKHVLKRLRDVYADKNVWMTYGNYRSEPDHVKSVSRPFPKKVLKEASFRTFSWRSSHLRTYYAKLFQKIKKKDLCINGVFAPMAPDVALMFPMLEMASDGHIHFIKEVLYIYNYTNPLSEHNISRQRQIEAEMAIRNKKPYKKLSKLF